MICWILSVCEAAGTTSQLPVKGAHVEPLVLGERNRSQPTLVKALQQLTDFQRITTTADDEGMFHTPHSADNEHPPLDAVPRTDTFEQGRGHHGQEQAAQIREERLERKIGQLVVEVDWLSKKCKELGIDP